jgi:hypothetical protein
MREELFHFEFHLAFTLVINLNDLNIKVKLIVGRVMAQTVSRLPVSPET